MQEREREKSRSERKKNNAVMFHKPHAQNETLLFKIQGTTYPVLFFFFLVAVTSLHFVIK